MNVTGTTGNETLTGSSTDDLIEGLGGFDTLNGLAGNDALNGGDGDDVLSGGSGNDTLTGGAGFDAVSYGSTANDGGTKQPTGSGVTVNLKTGTATDNWGDTDTLTSIEFIHGSAFDDILTGGNPVNDLVEGFRGMGGNDTIDGGSGFDRVFYDNSPLAILVTLGGTGSGTASDGFGGTDTFINIEEVRASAFNDTLTGSDSGEFESFEGRAGNDTIDGKGSWDRASYQTSTAAINVNLVTGIAQDGWGGTDTLLNMEEVRGSAFNDVIIGNSNSNVIEGQNGDDTMDGGAGIDTLRYDNSTGNVIVNLALGNAIGAAGNDTLTNFENVRASNFSDTLTGDNKNNVFRGQAGDDTIDGGASVDASEYVNARSGYTVTKTSTGFTVASAAEGSDTLSNIERLYFSGERVAFDTSGAAGTTALILGVLTGKASLQNKALVGTVLGLVDGGLTLANLAELAVTNGIVSNLAGGADNTSFAKLLLRNLLGSDTNAALVDTVTGLITSGAYTQATLLTTAAGLDANKVNIDLVGLAQTGLTYTTV